MLDGKISPVEDDQLPIGYSFYKWRKMMGAGNVSSSEVLMKTVIEDLEYDKIESDLSKSKENKINNA